MTSDRWILMAAWTLIAGAGAAGLSRISKIPALDPVVRAQCERLKQEALGQNRDPIPADDSVARVGTQWRFDARGLAATAMYFEPKVIERVVEGPIRDVPVQPWAATPEARASLDGVALTWTLAKLPVELGPRERAKDVAFTGLRIERLENGAWKEVAKLDAKATSWADVETTPKTVYAYRVKVEAPKEARAAKDGPSCEARTPSNRRAKLIGGDAKVAILRVETYNRKSKAWEGRDATAKPGDELWPGGWRLSGLRFKGFVLVADVAGEDGRAAELTTKD